MKLLPVADWINGIAMVPKAPPRVIEIPNQRPGTRCYLIESVYDKAFEAGYRPGDIVVSKSVFDLFFYGGAFHRVKFKLEEIIDISPLSLEEFTLIDGTTPVLPTLSSELITARRTRQDHAARELERRRNKGMSL